MHNKITYETVKNELLDKLNRENRSQKIIENHVSAFNSYIKILDLNITDEATAFDDFENSLNEYFERAKLGARTVPGRKSQLKNLHRVYLNLDLSKKMPPNFIDRLNYLMKLDGRFYHLIARLAGLKANTLRGWKIGKCLPAPGSMDKVKRLEKILGVSDGTLYRAVKHAKGNNFKIRSQAPKTDYMKRLKKNHGETYYFKYKYWTEDLKSQWRIIEEHFTNDIPPELPRHEKSYWSEETVEMRLSKMESFFGFLLLDSNCSNPRLRGLGFNVSDLHVTLSADKNLVEKFIAFKKERNKLLSNHNSKRVKGFNSNGIKDMLCCFNSYVHPDHGIFRHCEKFKDKIATGEKSWDDFCDDAHKRYVILIRKTTWVKTREPIDRISYYLESTNPKKYLKELVIRMREDNLITPHTTKINEQALIHFSRYFLCAFLFANPLRIKMFTIMRLGKNLYFRENSEGKTVYQGKVGDWNLRFMPEDFKNSKHTAKHPYNVRCAAWLSPIIQEYLAVYRPLSVGANDCDYLFRPCAHVPSDYETIHPIRENTLSNWVDFATKKYLGSYGFRPQAFRHIIAHDYIKNHPKGFQIVASILHDTLQTVIKNYGHLTHHDWFDNYNNYTENFMKDFDNL
jgi:hypothetical protein